MPVLPNLKNLNAKERGAELPHLLLVAPVQYNIKEEESITGVSKTNKTPVSCYTLGEKAYGEEKEVATFYGELKSRITVEAYCLRGLQLVMEE